MKFNPTQRFSATKRLTLISASANLSLALLKLLCGYLSHSQSLIADGFHSLSDILSDVLILTAAMIGKRIPDQEHPYGHQRFETIAAIILALLMFSAGGGIFYANLSRLVTGYATTIHTLPVIAVSLISIIVYTTLYMMNQRIGKRVHSNLLISNSYHNRSDAYTSSIVMFAAIGTLLHLPHLDMLAAIIISILIIKMGCQIFWNGLQELLDAGVDEATLQNMLACIKNVPGVTAIHQLRTRLHSGAIFADVHVIVAPFLSVSEGHHIGEQVHFKLMRAFPKIIDVIVHIDPEDDEKNRPCLHLPSRKEILKRFDAVAEQLPCYNQIQKIDIHYYDGQIYLTIVLPYSVVTRIENAALITEKYQDIQSHFPEITKVNILFAAAESL